MEAPTRQLAFIWVLGIWSQVLILACTADTFIYWVIFQTLLNLNIFTSIKIDMCCFLYPGKADINVCDICWNDIQSNQQENPVHFGLKKKTTADRRDCSVIIAAYDVDTEGHENISLLIVSGISFYRIILQMVKGVMAISGVNESLQRLHISTLVLFLALESSHGGSTFAALYKMTSRGRCYCTHHSISKTNWITTSISRTKETRFSSQGRAQGSISILISLVFYGLW